VAKRFKKEIGLTLQTSPFHSIYIFSSIEGDNLEEVTKEALEDIKKTKKIIEETWQAEDFKLNG